MSLGLRLVEPWPDNLYSLVLAQSITQTRLRHQQKLLPHIFSHPPIPSNLKPRARPPARSTFTYPTPAPSALPLPYREYHGPHLKNAPEVLNQASGSASPVPGGDDIKMGAASGARTERTAAEAKASKAAKRAAKLDEAYPAHETECIARITLSIGPFSYPDTELWVGRFVEPKKDGQKVSRGPRVVDRKDRALGNDEPVMKRPRMSAAQGSVTASSSSAFQAKTVTSTPRPSLMTPGPKLGNVRPPLGSPADASQAAASQPGSSTATSTAGARPPAAPNAPIVSTWSAAVSREET